MQQLFYSFGLQAVQSEEILWFYQIARGITEGQPRGQLDPKFGNIYWEPEELAYLRTTYNERGDPKEFAKREILHGRKSKRRPVSDVHKEARLCQEEQSPADKK